MNNLMFNNKYDVTLCALSLLLDHSKKEDQLFAAQCIWWLASIIQFTEILTYYQLYNIFPSDYLNNAIVTLTLSQSDKGLVVPEIEILILDITTEIAEQNFNQAAVHSSTKKLLPDYRDYHHNNKKRTIHTTQSETTFKNSCHSSLEVRFGKPWKRQMHIT